MRPVGNLRLQCKTPPPFAGRGGVSWCHLLLCLRDAPARTSIWTMPGRECTLGCAVTGASGPLTMAYEAEYRSVADPCEGDIAKGIHQAVDRLAPTGGSLNGMT
jgi:hypothetical protein